MKNILETSDSWSMSLCFVFAFMQTSILYCRLTDFISPLIIHIGLTYLPKPGWAIAHSAHPSPTFLDVVGALLTKQLMKECWSRFCAPHSTLQWASTLILFNTLPLYVQCGLSMTFWSILTLFMQGLTKLYMFLFIF